MEKIQAIGAKLYEATAKEEKPSEEEAEKSEDKKDDEPVEGEVVDEKEK